MINKVIQSKVNLDGTYKSAILGTVTALSEFTTTIQLISPIQLQTAVMVNFLVYDARNENISLFMQPTNKKGADVSNDVDVANWNVWEVDIDSVVLSKISKYRAGRIGVSYTFYERTTSNIALNYKGLFDSYDTIPVGTYVEGDYFISNAYNVLYNGLLFNYQDNAVYHNGKWVKDRNIKLILTTTTTDLSVDPSLLANVPKVDEQDILDIIASWGQAFVDAVALEPRVNDLEAEVIRLDTRVKDANVDIALKVSTSDIVDNLTSTDTDKPLSANQGKVLNDTKENLSNKATNFTTVNDTLYPSVEAVKEQLDLKANVAQEDWITPTLLNGATGTIQYMKDTLGFVHFRGEVTMPIGASTTFIFMPSGYRISLNAMFPVWETNSNVSTRVFIITTGPCYLGVTGDSTKADLSSVIYKAEA